MGDELDLSGLNAMEPPDGFADRVMAARRKATPAPRMRRFAAALVLAAAACAGILFFLRWPSRGEASPSARQSFSLGGRATAVAEAGSQFSWTVSPGGAAEIEQTRGDVFYRVERGGPFRVHTGSSEIDVTGTCFRVEVVPMASSPLARMSLAAVAGAAVASAVLVTVYEGKVRFSSAGAASELGPGESARAGFGESSLALSTTPALPASAPAGDPAQASREQLLQRDRESRAQIAALQSRLHEMESERKTLLARAEAPRVLGFDGQPLAPGMPPPNKFHDFTPEEKTALAAQCELRIGTPSLGREAFTMNPDKAAALHLSDSEQAQVTAAMNQVSQSTLTQLRALYIAATGDVAGADSLAPANMGNEIMQKSSRAMVTAAATEISRELAGLAQPPADPSTGSIPEQYFRLMLSLGDSLQQQLTPALGSQQAAAVRDGLTDWQSTTNGCANP